MLTDELNPAPQAAEAPQHDVRLSVVLPAYAEAENLAVLLGKLQQVLGTLPAPTEILVIDAVESLDDTPTICAQFGAQCVHRRGGNEYGNAIRTGIATSAGEYVIIMDVDGSHDPEFITQLWAAREQADVVIASRYMRGGSTENPALLVWCSKFLNGIFKLFLQLPVWDISNSYRIYRGEELRKLELEFMHFDIQEEMLAKLLWNPAHPVIVREIPFRFQRRLHGKSKRSMAVFLVAFLGAMIRLYLLKQTLTGKK